MLSELTVSWAVHHKPVELISALQTEKKVGFASVVSAKADLLQQFFISGAELTHMHCGQYYK